MIARLAGLGVGCYIGGAHVGALSYADDIVLIAPTSFAMRRMLSLCDQFASEYRINFNSQESKCVVLLPIRAVNL
jgi:hypothetical protein